MKKISKIVFFKKLIIMFINNKKSQGFYFNTSHELKSSSKRLRFAFGTYFLYLYEQLTTKTLSLLTKKLALVKKMLNCLKNLFP